MKKSSRLPADASIIKGEGMYVGAMDSDGKREGIGKLFYSNGVVYEGEWMAD